MIEALRHVAAYRTRLGVRAVFLLLAIATLLLGYDGIRRVEQQQRELQHSYRESLDARLQQLQSRLEAPLGQWILLNPSTLSARHVAPFLLPQPYTGLDVNDLGKSRETAQMAGCVVELADVGALCTAVGSDKSRGAYLYVTGVFPLPASIRTHKPGALPLDSFPNVRLQLTFRGEVPNRWVAMFQQERAAGKPIEGRFRIAAYRVADWNAQPQKPDVDVTGVASETPCVARVEDAAIRTTPLSLRSCVDTKEIAFALRLPIDAARADILNPASAWPPVDMLQAQVWIQIRDGAGGVILDSETPGNYPRVKALLNELTTALAAGQKFKVVGPHGKTIIETAAKEDRSKADNIGSVVQQIAGQVVSSTPSMIHGTARGNVKTSRGDEFAVELDGEFRGSDTELTAQVQQIKEYVAAMLLFIALGWTCVELLVIRRVTAMTRLAADVLQQHQIDDSTAQQGFAQMRGRDELGVLASTLDTLMRRVSEEARKQKIRVEQDQDMLRSVGHEIRSPLSGLMSIYAKQPGPGQRYVQRMFDAVQLLFGEAAPSQAFSGATVELEPVDLAAFLRAVAENAPEAGITNVVYIGPVDGVIIDGDAGRLEDAITHILNNARDFRQEGSAIEIRLAVEEKRLACITVHNNGPRIADDLMGKLFGYGVTRRVTPETTLGRGNRGQGLFVVKSYISKMNGEIEAENVDGGVEFRIRLPLRSAS